MKTNIFFFILCTLLLSAAPGVAQPQIDGKRLLEVKIGYGISPVQAMNEAYDTELVPAMAAPGYASIEKSGSGVFNATVMYQSLSRLGIGIDMIYGKTNSTFKYSNGTSTSIENLWFTLMARGQYTYYANEVKKPNIALYGAASIGSSFRVASGANSTNYNSTHFAYQLTPIGIRVGQQFAFWAEAGYGFRGLANAGLSWMF